MRKYLITVFLPATCPILHAPGNSMGVKVFTILFHSFISTIFQWSSCQLLSVPDILSLTGLLYVSLSNGISRVHWIRLYVVRPVAVLWEPNMLLYTFPYLLLVILPSPFFKVIFNHKVVGLTCFNK